MMRLAVAIPISVLPQRWRARLGFYDGAPASKRAAEISGLAQFLLCLGLLVEHYFRFVYNHTQQLIHLGGAGSVGSLHVAFGMGLTVFLEFVLTSPMTWALSLLLLDGCCRFFVALITGEVVASAPLKLLDVFLSYWERLLHERSLPPLVEDEVLHAGLNSYIVHSSRQKDWDLSTVVRMNDRLFEVCKTQEIADDPRPFKYHLRRLPPGRTIRKIRDIDVAGELPTTES